MEMDTKLKNADDLRFPTASKSRSPRAAVDTGRGTIIATAEMDAPPERVFRALTTKEVERCWGHPEFYHQKNWKGDFRRTGRRERGPRGS